MEIERAANKLKVTIHTSRPGIIIGRKGQEVDKLKQEVQKRTGKEVFINIQEILKPELDAQLVCESVALQLEKRIAFRRAMRKAVDAALRFGARGIKIRVSGRLNGAEIARSEWYLNGQLPLHTLRADIDYGFHEAHTTFGQIGVKTWIYRGETATASSTSGGTSATSRPRWRPWSTTRTASARIALLHYARRGEALHPRPGRDRRSGQVVASGGGRGRRCPATALPLRSDPRRHSRSTTLELRRRASGGQLVRSAGAAAPSGGGPRGRPRAGDAARPSEVRPRARGLPRRGRPGRQRRPQERRGAREGRPQALAWGGGRAGAGLRR